MTFDEKIELTKKRHCWPRESVADIFENGFISGASFTKSEFMPLLEKALDALDFISKTDISENPPDLLWLNNWRNTRKEVANQTAKEIREVLK